MSLLLSQLGGAPPAATLSLRTLMGVGAAIAIFVAAFIVGVTVE